MEALRNWFYVPLYFLITSSINVRSAEKVVAPESMCPRSWEVAICSLSSTNRGHVSKKVHFSLFARIESVFKILTRVEVVELVV